MMMPSFSNHHKNNPYLRRKMRMEENTKAKTATNKIKPVIRIHQSAEVGNSHRQMSIAIMAKISVIRLAILNLFIVFVFWFENSIEEAV